MLLGGISEMASELLLVVPQAPLLQQLTNLPKDTLTQLLYSELAVSGVVWRRNEGKMEER